MRDDLDHYEIHYADRLWNLLPEVYRATDSDELDVQGPLRELCDRIGAQMAIVRRSIDRTWEDQSIESCDDWAVPYIAELLATNLVAGPDLPGQRREVAKTIYYRRRKGTVALIEELVNDVTGWDARVVEFFRRLGRTHHGLDPELGLPSEENERLQLAAGLIGRFTKTPAGGTASLRNAYGASQCGGAFDEFSYTPDLRRGEGRTGWYNIPNLGIFLWRLYSFPHAIAQPNDLLVTPVAAAPPCTGFYSFDPTGRDVPLFSAGKLPVPIARELLEKEQHSFGFFDTDVQHPLSALTIWPEAGRFEIDPPASAKLRVHSHYGFSSRIGAGGYDRRPFATLAASSDVDVHGGGVIASIPPSGIFTITDSLTYDALPDVTGIGALTIRSANGCRPLIRPAIVGTEWHLQSAQDGRLRLEGIFTSGADIVLRGHFDEVAIAFSTFDPGSTAMAIDGRPLPPSTLWIEGHIGKLTIARSIAGPIRARLGGTVEELTIRDSIVHEIELDTGTLSLEHTTVLGPIKAHRIDVSESILSDDAQINDPQHGCVRFSAWTAGSVLPRKYESVAIHAGAELFTSRAFGHPGFAQLRSDAGSVRNGAQNGAEMGAFYGEMAAIKERRLLIKLQEYMPLGLTPVLVHVT